MKHSRFTLIALFSLCAASTAIADSYTKDSAYYAQVGYTPLSVSDENSKYKPKLARFTVGKDIHENLSVEAMYAATVSKDNQQDSNISSSGYGVFLKPKVEIAKDTELFGRIGWFKSTLKATSGDLSETASGSDTSYGLGVQTKFTDSLYGQVDYMNYYHKNGVTSKAVSFSIGTRF
jgi:opacity protein-like surface antigen